MFVVINIIFDMKNYMSRVVSRNIHKNYNVTSCVYLLYQPLLCLILRLDDSLALLMKLL